MFWRFGGYASISSIDTLLDKPDVSLEELLDESELIQELKQHNTKLIEYLRDDNVLKRLMDHVTAPSLVNEDDDEDDVNDTNGSKDATTEEGKRGDPLKDILDPEDLERAEKERLKRAYVACEILSAEVWSILDSIMLNPDHLRDFWGFLRRSPPLDSLQASYFTKVNETLFDRKTSEMLGFLKSLEGIIPAILQHIDNPMVMDLLLKIISLEKVEGGQGIVDWLKTQDLIPKLLSFLSSEWPASVQTSAGDFLKAIITISANATQNDQTCIGPNSLTRQLVSRPCVESLIKAMLQGGNPLTVGVGIVIEVIRKNNSDYDPDTINSPDSLPTTYDPIYLGNLLRIFAKHIPDFMKLIQSSKHTVKDGEKLKSVDRGRLSSAWGAKIEPLGFDRFKTCELMAELLHCSNMALLNQPGSEEYVQQRDAEREKLLREGAFISDKEEASAFDGNDSTVDFVNGSMVGYGSPEDSRVLEAANTGEDGFEDVSSSGVLADKEKDTAEAKDTSGQEVQSQAIPSSELQDSAPVEEQESGVPVHKIKEQNNANEETTQTRTLSSDPMSPTALGITDQVEEVTIDTNQKANDNRLSTEEAPKESPVTLTDNQEQETAPTSSVSESAPPPLFASKQQNQQSSSQTPDTSGQAGDASSSTDSAGEVQITEGEPRQHMHPDIQLDPNGQPVVGDYLKLMFVENRVVPTILGFFFRFPWNNFLHNVVYDVIQQVFNGPMERGYNRVLAIDVFETGRITQEIVEGQKRSDETQRTKQIRLGYMGHLTLIAEEVVKFSERHPPELLSPTVMENVLNPEWIDYVEQTLSETRERDNAILGGVRPDMSIGHRQGMLNSGQSMTGSSALADAGLNGAAGGSTFQGFDMMSQGSVSGGAFGLSGGGSSLLSGFASSSDDEDEDMEDQEDRNLADQSAEGGSENASINSTSQPIPILPPPPAPLSLGPSRARRQLAARLAAQKQQAAEGTGENGEKGEEKAQTNVHESSQWPANPFVVAGVDDDGDGGGSPSNAFPSTDFPSANKDEPFSSPTFPDSGFSPPDSFSTNSSEDDVEGRSEGLRRKERIPLEVDDDDDDDMGEMVGPSGGTDMMDSDEEDEAIMNESLGYPDLGPGRYKSFRRSRFGVSPFGDDDQNDSSDGEDDGLVEILVPGRKS
ncbi:SIT4 phosphatase-associated protein-domain-containing protein [Aspergillus pseudotamarii]|uniref:SIT4 phosphatase-associated protein-domain-containing protein n=1 Tax=Aspergillus pseudotamarii TaxID=132259 RepID=A0A5N6SFC6_ASPPS|nr:SIT4 phosphatase-associated protein-domain-containing protein [Aspergillus pseudotamarii]KAE8133418.1 SIT4 phosphatase-associated protein-domain-containing protein [Aspergillus pseudotamarii]